MPRSTRPLTRMLLVLPLALLAACGPGAPVAAEPAEPGAEPMDHLDYTMNRIDGAEEPLDTYRGKVVLVVNVASKCGLTPQYKGLEALYLEKQEDGLVILGFPANNFMGQEPGTNEQIAAFCEENYGVTFPMFEKISVKGDDAHPLYQGLAAETEEPSWNFTKYLLDREGRLVERYGPRTAPDDETLRARIDELLATG
jgi:glutathione peroxidase